MKKLPTALLPLILLNCENKIWNEDDLVDSVVCADNPEEPHNPWREVEILPWSSNFIHRIIISYRIQILEQK